MTFLPSSRIYHHTGCNQTVIEFTGPLTQGKIFKFWQRGWSTELVENVVVPLFLSLQKYIDVQHMEKHKGLRLNLKKPPSCVRRTWNTTLDFSSRYVRMLAPMMWYLLSKPISIYFPKRLLLSLRVVFAFPMACTEGKKKKKKKC